MRRKRTPVNAIAGPYGLRYCKIRVLDSPRAYVLPDTCDRPRRSKLALNAGVHRSCEELTNQRAKQDVTPLITSQERRLSPRAPHLELECCSKLARMKVFFRKWSSLVKRTAADR